MICGFDVGETAIQNLLQYAVCSIPIVRNTSPVLCSYSFLVAMQWISKLSVKCLLSLLSQHSVCCNSVSCFRKSLLLPWVNRMESWRSRWDKLSMATSLAATLDLEPFKVFAQIPSISCILYLSFSGQLHFSTGHLCHWMTNSYSMGVHGFAAQLVKAEW